ncbi:DUF3560 domain-containing protein [Nonomuraea salmonea]|uniref:DUF3560 domain-containing protein n=1 Tax=Nonomuraea salmonea TaxID=46181 RepID=A0ABV5P358_9ACTN
MTTIRIVHTRAEGTLIEGSTKGDGVYQLVRDAAGFRWSRNVGIYLPHSRDRAAKRWEIGKAADALRGAGFTVETDIDDVTAGRRFADAEAERVEAAEARHERFSARASRNAASSDARWQRTRERMSHVPPGQPILAGHHSERGHRRLLAWADRQDGLAVEEGRKAQYWAGRAAAAGAYEQHRTNPGRTLRRLDKLEAERRALLRRIETGFTKETRPGEPGPEGAELVRSYPGGWKVWKVQPPQEWADARQADLDQLDDEIGYWKHVIEQAQENGVKIWSKADFAKGDFVITRGTAVEVTRANAKSVTIPWCHYWVTSGPLVTVEAVMKIVNGDGHMSNDRMHTDTLRYDDVQGRISKDEMAELLERKVTVAELKQLIALRIREARGEQPADADQ